MERENDCHKSFWGGLRWFSEDSWEGAMSSDSTGFPGTRPLGVIANVVGYEGKVWTGYVCCGGLLVGPRFVDGVQLALGSIGVCIFHH